MAGGTVAVSTTAAARPRMPAATSPANIAAGPGSEATQATRTTIDAQIAQTP